MTSTEKPELPVFGVSSPSETQLFERYEPPAPERSLYGCCDNKLCMCLPVGCNCPGSARAQAAAEAALDAAEDENEGCPHASWNVTSEWRDKLTGKWVKTRLCNDCGEELDKVFEDKPNWDLQPAPQPVRRPPYAVAYSVADQLFEIALPGDATVAAVDGALVIKHTAAVGAIVQVAPIENRENASG